MWSGGIGWALRLFLSPVLGHRLKCLDWFLLQRSRGVSLGMSSILSPSRLCHPVVVPHCRLDCLMSSSVWDWWWCGGVSPCARPLGFRIVLMSGVNYRYTVIVRVGIRCWQFWSCLVVGCECWNAFADGCGGLVSGGFFFFPMCRGCGVLLS
jgi:hypothetical protein